MKRLLTSVLAAATFAAPLALPLEAAAQHRHRDHDRNRDHRRDHDRDHRRDHDRNARRDHDRGNHRGWDRSRYNGYTYRGRWYYGPPPASYDHRYIDYGWRTWRRGDRLPSYYRTYYRPVDYRYYRLRPPPRGYHYVRDDRGDLLLVGIATGVILGVIMASN